MTFVPFGEWLPDQPDYHNPGSALIQNVLPVTAQSYGPMPSPVVYSGNGLTARCQGSYSVADSSGNSYIFAGDVSRLYLLKAGSTSFADVSKAIGGPYATPSVLSGGSWSMTSFGERVVATNFVDPVQTFLVGTDATFSDLAAAAPKAKFAAVIRDFLVLANTVDGVNGAQPQRIWWPALGNPTSWPTPGTDAAIQVQSDYQDLQQTDLGEITGLVGGHLSSADGAVFCERGVYRISYAGSPAIFDIAVAEGAAGTRSPLSIVQRRLGTAFGSRSVVYYLGEDGFYAFDGAISLPIGAQKIDKTFFADLDPNYLEYVQGVADPITKMIFWAYHGPNNTGTFNRLLAYNWELQRWSQIIGPVNAEWLARPLSIGYTLDQLDAFGTLDTLPASLDSRVWTGGAPLLAMFDNAHKLNLFTGPNFQLSVETSEVEFFPGRRAKILSARPMIDGGTNIAVSALVRDRLIDATTASASATINSIGECPLRTTGRYCRFRLAMDAGSKFGHLQGIDATVRPEGRR